VYQRGSLLDGLAMYLSCDTKKFHDNESTHILHNFWTSTHREKLPPGGATGCRGVRDMIVTTVCSPQRRRPSCRLRTPGGGRTRGTARSRTFARTCSLISSTTSCATTCTPGRRTSHTDTHTDRRTDPTDCTTRHLHTVTHSHTQDNTHTL